MRTRVSGTQCLETAWVIHAAALCTTTSRGLCYVVRKEDKVKRKTSLKKVIMLSHANVLEIEPHRSIPLLDLQYLSELSAPYQNYPKQLFCCSCCSTCPKPEVTTGVRGNNGIGFEVGCSFPAWFHKRLSWTCLSLDLTQKRVDPIFYMNSVICGSGIYNST